MPITTCKGCGLVRKYTKIEPKLCRECTNKERAKNAIPRNLYSRWTSMVLRCTDPSCVHYKNYGGRGITVCDTWRDNVRVFSEWALANGYIEGTKLTLDRIDNDKGYYPDNCRFATRQQQANNTRLLSSSNTTGYRGVSNERGRYRACVNQGTKTAHLGSYENAESAAVYRDIYILRNNLPHMRNFPDMGIEELRKKTIKAKTKRLANKTKIHTYPRPPKRGASGYYGVDFESSRGKFRVGIQHNGKHIRLGTFQNATKAAIVRDDYIICNNIHGRHMNFPMRALLHMSEYDTCNNTTRGNTACSTAQKNTMYSKATGYGYKHSMSKQDIRCI